MAEGTFQEFWEEFEKFDTETWYRSDYRNLVGLFNLTQEKAYLELKQDHMNLIVEKLKENLNDSYYGGHWIEHFLLRRVALFYRVCTRWRNRKSPKYHAFPTAVWKKHNYR